MSFTFTEPEATPVTEPEVTTTTTPEQEVTDNATDTPDSPADSVPASEGQGDNPSTEQVEEGKGDQPESTDSEPVSYFWGDTEVEVEIPQDVEESLKAVGIDAKQVAAELYAKDGKFELSKETREKLEGAFGKFAVDAYLSGLKAQNELFMYNLTASEKEAEAANAQRFTDISKEVGGEEGWSKLEEWALQSLSDEDLAAFNAVMESGNQYLQTYAVRELEGRRKAAMGDDRAELIEPTSARSDAGDNGPLSATEYMREIGKLSERFGNDRKAAAEAQARLDARRRAGMARGL